MSITTNKQAFDIVHVTAVDDFDPTATYTLDSRHFPAPISPLFQSVIERSFSGGFTDAATALNLPLAGAKVAIRNHYVYHAFVPVIPKDEETARSLGERAEATIKAEIPRLMERWESAFLPRLEQNLDRLEAMDFDRFPADDIPFLLDEIVEISKDNWSIHFKIAIPMAIAMQLYDELYADLFGGGEQDAHALLIGLPSESVRAEAGLSDLAAAAKAAGLAELILSVPAGQVMAALASAPNGEYYAAAIRDYVHEYGLRQDLFDVGVPTWQEDPTVAIASIQTYLRTGHDARAAHERALRAAVTALNAARAQLSHHPAEVRGRFEATVAAARAAYFLQQEHNVYTDQRSLALSRLAFLRLGDRLTKKGALAKSDDIFMLSLDEIESIATRALSEEEIGAVRMLILEREGELQRAAKTPPPSFIGTAPAGPPPASNLMERAMLRFFGSTP